jgi:uncharacterized metal-binding protein YceD (DUF177 family)
VPGAESRRAIADELGLIGLRKLRLEGRIEPEGQRDWRLVARLGATVVQPCVATLAPVTTRIDEDITRIWRADFAEPEGDEVELPEEVDDEPLGAVIDIGAVMVEALALALPAYPRAEGAALDVAAVTEPGKAALTDEAAKPFAGLAALRDKMTGGGEPDGD